MIDKNDIQSIVCGHNHTWQSPVYAFFSVSSPAACEALETIELTSVESLNAARKQPGTLPLSINVAVTHDALEKLGLDEELLRAFPGAFSIGMRKRANALGDTGASAPEKWDSAWRKDVINLMIVVHARERDQLQKEVARIEQLGKRTQGLKHVHTERSERLTYPDEQNMPMEHFGFKDGASNPPIENFSWSNPPGSGKLTENGWKPLAAGEFLLGHMDEAGEMNVRPELKSICVNGSFLVFRKLQQNVLTFRQEMERVAVMNNQASPKQPVSAQYIAAKLVGRNQDGSPLSGAKNLGPPNDRYGQRKPLNDFRHADDPDGLRCPLGSHIRRTNPRDAQGFSTLLSDRHRLLRRGASYGSFLKHGEQDDQPRGLFFIALNASLERQFEFVQGSWVNTGDEFAQGDAVDPLTGTSQMKDGDRNYLIPKGLNDGFGVDRAVVCPQLKDFVTTKGGGYFFLPGIEAWRSFVCR